MFLTARREKILVHPQITESKQLQDRTQLKLRLSEGLLYDLANIRRDDQYTASATSKLKKT